MIPKVAADLDPRGHGLCLLAHACLGDLWLRSLSPGLPPRVAVRREAGPDEGHRSLGTSAMFCLLLS